MNPGLESGGWGAAFLALAVPLVWGGLVAWGASRVKKRLDRKNNAPLPKQETPPDAHVPIYHI